MKREDVTIPNPICSRPTVSCRHDASLDRQWSLFSGSLRKRSYVTNTYTWYAAAQRTLTISERIFGKIVESWPRKKQVSRHLYESRVSTNLSIDLICARCVEMNLDAFWNISRKLIMEAEIVSWKNKIEILVVSSSNPNFPCPRMIQYYKV